MRVTLTYAQSLDGRIATADGSSQWISGKESLQLAHELRGQHDAILVGVGTVLADDPRLTCRLAPGRNPHRFVLDGQLRTPLHAHVADTREAPTTIFCSHDAEPRSKEALEQAGVTVKPITEGSTGLVIEEALDWMVDAGHESLMVEGGSHVITEFLRLRLVDELVLVEAPIVVGSGTEAVMDLNTTNLDDALRGRTKSVRQMGQDVVWRISFGESDA